MQLQAVVVDDEQFAREELCFLLAQIGGIEIIGQAGNGIEAVELIERLEPDIALLDVQMPGLGGFAVARRLLAKQAATQIVFVTAFDQYAIEAFEVNAVDYLLKPVEPTRLEEAVERVRKRLSSDRVSAKPALGSEALEQLVALVADREGRRRDQLAVKVGERFLLIQSEEIVFATLTDEVITIVTGSVVGASNYRTLDELQEQLDPATFWRVNRSHLVNINKIKEIVPWFHRNYILKMRDTKATEIPVSRSQTKRLREYLRL